MDIDPDELEVLLPVAPVVFTLRMQNFYMNKNQTHAKWRLTQHSLNPYDCMSVLCIQLPQS